MIPPSISGTSHGAPISSTTTESSRICTRSLYIRVRTVASVARTPILRYPPAITASAHGTVTPRICRPTNRSCCIQERAFTLEVLHAIITTSAPRSKSLCTHRAVSARISSLDLPQYGQFPRSISRIISISGNSFWNSVITTCPPSPESKNQIRMN